MAPGLEPDDLEVPECGACGHCLSEEEQSDDEGLCFSCRDADGELAEAGY